MPIAIIKWCVPEMFSNCFFRCLKPRTKHKEPIMKVVFLRQTIHNILPRRRCASQYWHQQNTSELLKLISEKTTVLRLKPITSLQNISWVIYIEAQASNAIVFIWLDISKIPQATRAHSVEHKIEARKAPGLRLRHSVISLVEIYELVRCGKRKKRTRLYVTLALAGTFPEMPGRT